jgi:MerR family transcriptional regulator, thiopeptide resistance regulator
MLYTRNEERRQDLDHHFYHTSEFAEMASVSVRTLRFYDKAGLLSPTSYTEAGYRLYTDRDFLRLQQILALKFLGFSLEEIKRCLQVGPTVLWEALALQRAMMQEKREQLDAVIAAIDETQSLLQSNQQEWESIVRVIRVMQMSQTNDWRKKYFSDAQLQRMEELSKQSYTEEQRTKLAAWGKDWSEEDQRVATQQWSAFTAELQRLTAAGTDPASSEALALAAQWATLISGFTHNDPGIQDGLKNLYSNLGKMPVGERPYPMPYNKEEGAFLQKMIEAYQQHQK